MGHFLKYIALLCALGFVVLHVGFQALNHVGQFVFSGGWPMVWFVGSLIGRAIPALVVALATRGMLIRLARARGGVVDRPLWRTLLWISAGLLSFGFDIALFYAAAYWLVARMIRPRAAVAQEALSTHERQGLGAPPTAVPAQA